MSVLEMFPVEPRIVDNDQRFTLRETDEWARRKAAVGAWDLDVAACDESHLAAHYFTIERDGLQQAWFGRVWCNPPFSDIEPWVERAHAEMRRGSGPSVIAMLIPATRTEQPWWQRMVEPFRDHCEECNPLDVTLETHFLPGRTKFGMPGNRNGDGVGSPPFTCVLLVWRR